MEEPQNSSTAIENQLPKLSDPNSIQENQSSIKKEINSEAVFVEKKGGYNTIKVKEVPHPLPGILKL